MLNLTNISAGYLEFQALFGIELEVRSGEAVAVVGPNGAGKTTLMRVISGQLPLTSGTIVLEGRNLTGIPPHQFIEQGIAHCPENRRLFPRLTVEENLKMGAFIPSARRDFSDRSAWVFELFPRLKERRRQMAGTLSGGEQQMVAIGRALMSKPKLLLLDEPSAGLAPVIVLQVFAMIRRIRSEGFTVLIVEQNIKQALELVDRAYLLEVGRIKLSGSAGELKDHKFLQKAYMGL